MLDSLNGQPALEALTMGHPERMGISAGWSEQRSGAAAPALRLRVWTLRQSQP